MRQLPRPRVGGWVGSMFGHYEENGTHRPGSGGVVEIGGQPRVGMRLGTKVGCGSWLSLFAKSNLPPFIFCQRLGVAHGHDPQTLVCFLSFLVCMSRGLPRVPFGVASFPELRPTETVGCMALVCPWVAGQGSELIPVAGKPTSFPET